MQVAKFRLDLQQWNSQATALEPINLVKIPNREIINNVLAQYIVLLYGTSR